MGRYLNPGNRGFERILKGGYVDKTGMIDLINKTIDTADNLICISRPRRFGKSFAAQMLCAYYDDSCDSHSLFDDKEIAGQRDYETYLNKFHVIYLDITGFISSLKRRGGRMDDLPENIVRAVAEEAALRYPGLVNGKNLSGSLVEIAEATGRKFIFIIDEWDAVLREEKNNIRAQEAYLNLLREWFKNGNFTPYAVAAAYMTGILPVKKDGSQSAISDFREYSVLYPGGYAAYTGFTETEVRDLCRSYAMDFTEAREWYDGYYFEEAGSIYNPYSVMSAMKNKKFRSYWQKTSAAEALLTYIDMDYEGLQEDMVRLISGERIEVEIDGFENDFATFRTKDDVLTLLVHLGYLAYDEGEGTVRIPNEEVRLEFHKILKKGEGEKLAALIRNSRKLLEDTIAGKEERVAKAIEALRDSEYAPGYYNDEQALRYVIRFAYIVCADQYLKIEEIPSGHGIADVVYIPKKRSPLPAMIVELKWNRTAEGALSQIRDRNYPAALKGYGGDILLVGVNYNDKTKKHSCRIERMKG